VRGISKGESFLKTNLLALPIAANLLQDTGCSAILVGESLIKQEDQAAAVRALLK